MWLYSAGSVDAFSLYSRQIFSADLTGLVKLFSLNIQAEIEKVNIVTGQEEDRNVLKMLMIVVGALVVFFVLIIIIAQIVSKPNGADMGVDKMIEAAIIKRIKPFGAVNVGSAPVAAASSSADGKGTYNASCAACHNSGAAGAPKLGDKGAWKARIAKGMAKLNESGINGVPGTAMSAKGGNASLSDDAVKAAVKYLVDGSK